MSFSLPCRLFDYPRGNRRGPWVFHERASVEWRSLKALLRTIGSFDDNLGGLRSNWLLRHCRSRGLLQPAAALMLAACCGMPGGARRPAHPRSSNCFFGAVGGGSIKWTDGAGSRQQAGQPTAAASSSSPRTRPAAPSPAAAPRLQSFLPQGVAPSVASSSPGRD
jgi:hypothetical protein